MSWALGQLPTILQLRGLPLWLRNHLVYNLLCHGCTRVAAAAEEVVYEVVAEPQGPAPQEEIRGESAQGPTHPSTEQQTQGKPRCTSFYF